MEVSMTIDAASSPRLRPVDLSAGERRLLARIMSKVPDASRRHLSEAEIGNAFRTGYAAFRPGYDRLNWVALPFAIAVFLSMFVFDFSIGTRFLILLPLLTLTTLALMRLQAFKRDMAATLTGMAARAMRDKQPRSPHGA
ncbi:MAG: hypothetical protein R3F55_05335 [Alphaproteobacteria bacterium]